MKCGCHLICNQWKLSDEIQTFIQYCRKWRGRGACAPIPPVFDRSFNPISTERVHYALHITMCPSSLRIFRPYNSPAKYYWNLLTTQKCQCHVQSFCSILICSEPIQWMFLKILLLSTSFPVSTQWNQINKASRYSYFVWEKGIDAKEEES